jgi:Berberine and berberine like
MSRVADDATAVPVRGSHFIMNIHGRWREASQDAECLDWIRHLFDRMSPHAVATGYVNFMPLDDAERVKAAYGSNYHRLSAIKSTYDPEGFSRMNQNVRPGW